MLALGRHFGMPVSEVRLLKQYEFDHLGKEYEKAHRRIKTHGCRPCGIEASK